MTPKSIKYIYKMMFLVIPALVVSTLAYNPAYSHRGDVNMWELALQKTAQYRKALWLNVAGEPVTLEGYMRGAFEAKPEVEDTKFQYSPTVDVQISARSTNGLGVGCYFTLYSEGKPTGTIENGGPEIRRRRAPNGEEYLKTGIHLVIQGNHIAYIATGHSNDGQITGLLHKFLRHSGFDNVVEQFTVMPRANRREVERLLRQGVKSIDLGISDFATAVQAMENPQVAALPNIFAAIATPIKNALLQGRAPAEAIDTAEIDARLQLNFDGRSAGDLVPAIMGQIAGQIYEGYNNDFKIITKNDVVITRDKLVIRRDITVDGDDITILPESAFSGLRYALDEWNQSGILND